MCTTFIRQGSVFGAEVESALAGWKPDILPLDEPNIGDRRELNPHLQEPQSCRVTDNSLPQLAYLGSNQNHRGISRAFLPLNYMPILSEWSDSNTRTSAPKADPYSHLRNTQIIKNPPLWGGYILQIENPTHPVRKSIGCSICWFLIMVQR